MIDAGWLRGMGQEGLARLLRRRPELMLAPAPKSLAELADRLASPYQVAASLSRLTLPQLQVTEALSALGGSASRQRLAQFLDDPAPDELDACLDYLTELALLAIVDDQVSLLPGVGMAWQRPLGLGPRAEQALQHRTAADLKALLAKLGASAPQRKTDLLAALLVVFDDGDRIRKIVAGAPEQIRAELVHSAMTGEPIEVHWSDLGYYHPQRARPTTGRWGIERGLLMRDVDGLVLVAQVALALRGPGYRAPFDPRPPLLARTQVARHAVDSGGVAASAATARNVIALMTAAGHSPIKEIKAGGIGVRELKRLAKLTGQTEPEVRLGLAVSFGLQLWSFSESGMAPTSAYDAWLRLPPAQQAAELLEAWWEMPHLVLQSSGPWQPINHGPVHSLRRDLLTELGDSAVLETEQLAAAIRWRHPRRFSEPADYGPTVQALVREAEMVGAVVAGAVTSAGRALLDEGDVAAALAGLGEAQHQVRLQADMTGVVAGSPAAELADFLDLVADREQRGAASTWRFTPDSVRRALDAGVGLEELLDGLSGVAVDGLPQPLEYLLRDVARGHGKVRVRAVACCLRCDDTGLLAQVVADRKLRGLGLSLLAPTVLASAKPVDETLQSLRAAGYAPVAEDQDGNVLMQARQVYRAASPARPAAPAPRRGGSAGDSASRRGGAAGKSATGKSAVARQPDAADLARQLLKAPDHAKAATGTAALIGQWARQLTDSEIGYLAYAIDHELPVGIAYTNKDGNTSTRVIEQIELAEGQLFAHCHLRDDDRCFNLSQIDAVLPVDLSGLGRRSAAR